MFLFDTLVCVTCLHQKGIVVDRSSRSSQSNQMNTGCPTRDDARKGVASVSRSDFHVATLHARTREKGSLESQSLF
eukprot:scaffold22596_cov131-Cylindrotheca_fusiformis.AAC.1